MDEESKNKKKEIVIDLNSQFNLDKTSIFNKEFSSVLLAPILIAVVLLIYGAYYYFEGKPFSNSQPTNQTTDSAPSPSINISLPNASSSAVRKEEIKIKILNGSGVAGQAGRVRNSLLKLGFKNIEIGNDPNADGEKTVVEYISQVNSDILDEILSELKRSFKNISTEKSKIDDFDVVIITGK
ncbi:LytR C-terminal domain-containing protein [Candidatus Daviesbacteria bacterium]|nr:LytR C-terminal domain-containing protein [Candidatus Daviesbacteria bacterium]